MKGAKKSKGTIEISGNRIPTHQLSGRTPIDPAKFIPIVPAPRARGEKAIRAIRRTDLLPKNAPAAVAAALNWGDQLLDIFSPTYGSFYPIGGKHKFFFSFSLVTFTRYDMWKMTLAWNKPGYQRLSFGSGAGSYLRVQLGMTQGAGVANGAIVHVKADSNYFLLDLSHRSFLFFDLILAGPAPHSFEFALSSQYNPSRESILEIQQAELWNSIRTFPDEEPVFG
ncbi:MAG TPA: hypothetical protein VFW45_07595 [Candidatus Polarisedimenticolia bacterium]|nr:hypothetical protein [Candidatus Polarisedimenticolia bacterium]